MVVKNIDLINRLGINLPSIKEQRNQLESIRILLREGSSCMPLCARDHTLPPHCINGYFQPNQWVEWNSTMGVSYWESSKALIFKTSILYLQHVLKYGETLVELAATSRLKLPRVHLILHIYILTWQFIYLNNII